MELSVDPVNKSLLRIFCQTIDNTIEYKSIEYSEKSTVHKVIVKLIDLLRLNIQISDLVLCEAVGRCMVLSPNGSIKKKVAKSGQACVFIEQNYRVLSNSDHVCTILTLWKPRRGFSRRFELCYPNTKSQMSIHSSQNENDIRSGTPLYSFSPNINGSLSSISTLHEFDSKSTQTDLDVNVPVEQHNLSLCSYLLTLKGDEDTLVIPLNYQITEIGTIDSNAKVCLPQLQKYNNQILCIFYKENNSQQTNNDCNYQMSFEKVCNSTDFFVTINGCKVIGKELLKSGDIINFCDIYLFFYKVGTSIPCSTSKAKHYHSDSIFNKSTSEENCNQSYKTVKSNSISSSSSISEKTTVRTLKMSKLSSTALHNITLENVGVALAQLVHRYIDNQIELQHAIGLTLYLLRFCTEPPNCHFTVDSIQGQMTMRFCKTFEDAVTNDNYVTVNFKLTALGFQIWNIYYTENSYQSTVGNVQWLNYFKSFTEDCFSYLSSYVCERVKNVSLYLFDDNLIVNIDKSEQNMDEDNICTMEKLLEFLSGVYRKINKIDCFKTIEIIKSVLTSRLIIYLTESTITVLLSNMKKITWQKGVQISTEFDKFKNWLKTEGLLDIYRADGFLHDFLKLVSTRSSVLKALDWKQLRHNYKGIPATVLRQFLLAIMINENANVIHWQPPQSEMFESNQDVSEVLSNYLRKKEQCSLFQPEQILQTECFDVKKTICSKEFSTICARLDKELISTRVNFQWMNLTKPQSLVNFAKNRLTSPSREISKNNQIVVLKQRPSSIVTDPTEPRVIPRNRKIFPRESLSNKPKMSNILSLNSMSLMSLNEPDLVTKNQIKTKYSPNIISQSNSISNLKNGLEEHNSVIATKESLRNRTTKPTNRFYKDTRSISSSIDSVNIPSKSPLFMPTLQIGDIDVPDNVYVDHKSVQDSCFDTSQIEVIITKLPEESYGITIVDGLLTNLKKEGIFIYRITKDSPAHKCQKIKSGDEIITINDYLVGHLAFAECLMLMKKSLREMRLVIEKCDLKEELQIIQT